MPKDLHVNERAALPLLLAELRGRPEVVTGQTPEVSANLVVHLQAVQNLVVGEQAAVVGRDLQRRVAQVDSPEQTPEVLVDRSRVVWISVLVRIFDGLLGQKR